MALGDGGGDILAIALHPALGEPFRRVEEGVDRLGEDGLAFTGQPPQQRIAERDIARGARILVELADRQIDGGMVRHVEEKICAAAATMIGSKGPELRGLPRSSLALIASWIVPRRGRR